MDFMASLFESLKYTSIILGGSTWHTEYCRRKLLLWVTYQDACELPSWSATKVAGSTLCAASSTTITSNFADASNAIQPNHIFQTFPIWTQIYQPTWQAATYTCWIQVEISLSESSHRVQVVAGVICCTSLQVINEMYLSSIIAPTSLFWSVASG